MNKTMILMRQIWINNHKSDPKYLFICLEKLLISKKQYYLKCSTVCAECTCVKIRRFNARIANLGNSVTMDCVSS